MRSRSKAQPLARPRVSRRVAVTAHYIRQTGVSAWEELLADSCPKPELCGEAPNFGLVQESARNSNWQ